jgi:aspartate/methionine/tyrosine aminotransferase
MRIQKADKLKNVKEYYFSRKLKEIQKLREQGKKVINLGIGSPDLPPSRKVIEKLAEEARHDNNHAYQSYTGLPELREAFAGWYQQYFDVKLSSNEILPLMGSKEGIMHISMAFLNPGDKVLIPDPGYPTYSSVTNLVGATPVFYDLKEENGWLPDWETIEKEDLSRVKLMWINYPNMPTGTPATKELFEKVVHFGLQHNILIVNDNPYSFVLNDEQRSILAVDNAKEIALELNSLSKSHNMAGWRVGMVAGDQEYISAVLQVKSNMDSGMFKAIQLAAAEAVKLNRAWYDQLNETYTKRKKIVFDLFDLLGFEYNIKQVGMFVWAKINKSYENAEQFSDRLLDQKAVFITPGSIFGSNGRQYVRISLCSNIETLTEAYERVAEFVKDQK